MDRWSIDVAFADKDLVDFVDWFVENTPKVAGALASTCRSFRDAVKQNRGTLCVVYDAIRTPMSDSHTAVLVDEQKRLDGARPTRFANTPHGWYMPVVGNPGERELTLVLGVERPSQSTQPLVVRVHSHKSPRRCVSGIPGMTSQIRMLTPNRGLATWPMSPHLPLGHVDDWRTTIEAILRTQPQLQLQTLCEFDKMFNAGRLFHGHALLTQGLPCAVNLTCTEGGSFMPTRAYPAFRFLGEQPVFCICLDDLLQNSFELLDGKGRCTFEEIREIGVRSLVVKAWNYAGGDRMLKVQHSELEEGALERMEAWVDAFVRAHGDTAGGLFPSLESLHLDVGLPDRWRVREPTVLMRLRTPCIKKIHMQLARVVNCILTKAPNLKTLLIDDGSGIEEAALVKVLPQLDTLRLVEHVVWYNFPGPALALLEPVDLLAAIQTVEREKFDNDREKIRAAFKLRRLHWAHLQWREEYDEDLLCGPDEVRSSGRPFWCDAFYNLQVVYMDARFFLEPPAYGPSHTPTYPSFANVIGWEDDGQEMRELREDEYYPAVMASWQAPRLHTIAQLGHVLEKGDIGAILELLHTRHIEYVGFWYSDSFRNPIVTSPVREDGRLRLVAAMRAISLNPEVIVQLRHHGNKPALLF